MFLKSILYAFIYKYYIIHATVGRMFSYCTALHCAALLHCTVRISYCIVFSSLLNITMILDSSSILGLNYTTSLVISIN